MNIEIITDFYTKKLTEFRKTILYEDCFGFDKECLNNINFNFDKMKNKNEKTFEDGFRFTAYKFFNTKFHHVACASINDNIYSFSGAVEHEKYMKIAIYHYSLKKYRKNKELRSPLWRENGFLDKHIDIAKKLNKDAVFFTIYNHNNSLKYFIENFKLDKRRHEKFHDLKNLQKFKYEGEIIYNQCEQSLFSIGLNKNFNSKKLIKEINGHISF